VGEWLIRDVFERAARRTISGGNSVFDVRFNGSFVFVDMVTHEDALQCWYTGIGNALGEGTTLEWAKTVRRN